MVGTRLARIEELLEVVVRIEERQTSQLRRLEELEKMVTEHTLQLVIVTHKVDKWIQRGMGLWFGLTTVALIGWTLFTYVRHD